MTKHIIQLYNEYIGNLKYENGMLKKGEKMIKLSDSEICIMHIIWKNGKTTSFDIIDEVKKNEKISENTIRTLLARMVKKQAIKISEKKGKTYIYEACINEDEFLIKEANNFLENVYQGAMNTMLLNFVKENKLTKKDVEDLLKKIEKED